jgi:hypothetical protein
MPALKAQARHPELCANLLGRWLGPRLPSARQGAGWCAQAACRKGVPGPANWPPRLMKQREIPVQPLTSSKFLETAGLTVQPWPGLLTAIVSLSLPQPEWNWSHTPG